MRRLDTLAIVIPTRNRAQLAENAARSVLAQAADGVRIIVVENSTDLAQREQVRRFCESHATAGIQLVTPSKPLPMAENWNFALETALAFDDVSHALVLTDRMLFKPGELQVLRRAVLEHPDRILIYAEDYAYDDRKPVALMRTRWTGDLVKVPADRLLHNASVMHLHPAPRVMNCVTPREVFDAVRQRFGTITGSAAPDYAFAYRSLVLVDAVYYYDRAPVLYYAWPRSNGQSFARGVHTSDSVDFLKNLESQGRLNGYAPIPELLTVVNAIANEYCKVQHDTASPRMPPIDRDAYLRANDLEIRRQNLNPELSAALLKVIESQGSFSRRPSLFHFIRKVLAIGDVAALRPLWRFLARVPRLQPPGDSPVAVESTAAALDLVAKRPRRRHVSRLHLRVLLGRTQLLGRYRDRHTGTFPPLKLD